MHTADSRRKTESTAGFTIAELLVTIAIAVIVTALIIPALGAGRSRSRELVSLSNLKTLAGAHAAYGVDWGDRQFTHMPDNMAQSNGTYGSYVVLFGCPSSVVLGFGGTFPESSSIGNWGYWVPCASGIWAANFTLLWPMPFGSVGGGTPGFGMWRFQNVVGLNEYVGGRFMDPAFYAPADSLAMSVVGPGLESPNPFTFVVSKFEATLSSFVSSPAAMYHPGVFGGDDGLFKSPYDFTEASVAPTVAQCAHPALKTRLTEYRWLQAPAFTAPLASPEGAFFNLGADSEPMTLFFDGHTAGLSVRKVLADNDIVVNGGGAKLWMDSEITEGPWAGYEGFYSNLAIDDTRTSFHVFTRGGILGRDVITPP